MTTTDGTGRGAGNHGPGQDRELGHDGDRRPYAVPLSELERGVHVPRELQVAEQEAAPPRTYVEPEDLDRARLLADPAGAGTLDPRR